MTTRYGDVTIDARSNGTDRPSHDTPVTARSAALFEEANGLMPGGVSSPVRAFRSVGGTPRFIARGEGAWIVDVDGNRYVDYVLSWGALALGHAHEGVVGAVTRQAALGTSFGAPCALESELASMIIDAVPSVEMVRFVSSGTEATASALRLARAATGRAKFIKFAGCYHGHADAFLVQAGSGVATLGLPDSPGVPAAAVADTLTAPYNDLAAVERLLAEHAGDVAAVIVEPVAGNMGFVRPAPGFLDGLRRLCTGAGALLIFDEVMTGFRVAYGGAQSVFGIPPDLTCFGKVMGGGMPVAAYGGPRALMGHVAPAGTMYQAGTLSGNPVAMAAGIAALRELSKPGTYDRLGALAATLAATWREEGARAGVPVQADAIGGMWGFFFAESPVRNYAEAKTADTARFRRFFHAMLDRGVYLAPSQFEAAFVSTAHDEATLEHTRRAVREAMGDEM